MTIVKPVEVVQECGNTLTIRDANGEFVVEFMYEDVGDVNEEMTENAAYVAAAINAYEG